MQELKPLSEKQRERGKTEESAHTEEPNWALFKGWDTSFVALKELLILRSPQIHMTKDDSKI